MIGNTFHFMLKMQDILVVVRNIFFNLAMIVVLIQDDHKDTKYDKVDDDDESGEVISHDLTLVSLWALMDECWNTFPLVCRCVLRMEIMANCLWIQDSSI